MKRNHQLLLLIPVAILMIAFSAFSGGGKPKFEGYEKVEGNSYFLLLKKGKGTAIVDTGGAMFVKIKFLTDNDSVFLDINKEARTPSYPMRADRPGFKGDFLDLLERCHVGDSAKFFISLDSLKKHYPTEFTFEPQFDTMKYLGMAVKIDSIYSRDKVVELRLKAEEEQKIQEKENDRIAAVMGPIQEKAKEQEPKLKKQDAKLLKKYLKSNAGFPASPDADGIYYREDVAGNGQALTPGMLLGLKYTGTYLDGTVFDSNQLVPNQPLLYFHIGTDAMIPGFTTCVLKMKVGGKSTFILPPAQGYNDSLTRVFNVELISAAAK